MSRRCLFLIIVSVIMLYFSIILFMLRPLHTVHGDPFSLRYPFKQVPVIDWCKPLRWRKPPQDVVALISYPGSGNTWLRYLLQQATGILTGSVYRDHGLQFHGFPGEEVTNGSVLVVKTHEQHVLHFQAAILLIRNPRDAILAEYNRMWRGHLGTAPKAVFKRRSINNEMNTIQKQIATNNGPKNRHLLPDWPYHFDTQLKAWEALHVTWLTNFLGPIHVVFYEHLVNDTKNILQGILRFLNVSVTESDLYCALTHKEGIYRRRNKHKDFDPFTPEMYKLLDKVKSRVYTVVDEYMKKHNETNKIRVNIISSGNHDSKLFSLD